MKILYITRDFLSDSDFPLLREMQNQGIRVDVYIFGGNRSAGILDISSKNIYGISKLSVYPELCKLYAGYININKLRFVNLRRTRKALIFDYAIMLYLFIKTLFSNYDILHITWPLQERTERLLYKLPIKKIWTVHDPIPHSSQEKQEETRKYAFLHCKNYIMLSDALMETFMERYGIDSSQIHLNCMGEFDYLRYIKPSGRVVNDKYILFFGQMAPHKGLEILLQAMVEVHKRIPNLKLIIAGNGKLDFNFEPYRALGYIIGMFRYIGIQEEVNLFKGAEILVCPYKDATQSGVVQTSFSLGLPVIGTNVGALPGIIEDYVTGKIVPPCDYLSLANAIVEIMNNHDLLQEMKNNIELKRNAQKSWKSIVNSYVDIYKRCLS